MQRRLLSHPLWLFSPCYFFWYLVGFSIYNPLPKISAAVSLWGTYAENLKFFCIYVFENLDDKKRAYYYCLVLYSLLSVFQFTNNSVLSMFSDVTVIWSYVFFPKMSFRYVVRSSQKDSCWGRGFKSYLPVYFCHLINYNTELSSIFSSCRTKTLVIMIPLFVSSSLSLSILLSEDLFYLYCSCSRQQY